MKIAILGCVDSQYHDGIRIGNALVRKGHQVTIYSLAENPEITIKAIKEFNPDFCLVTIGRDYDVNALKEIQKSTLLVHWAYDEYTPSKDHLYKDVKGVYDLTFVKATGLVPLLKDYCKKVVWTPMYYDHYADGAANTFGKVHDIVFVGEPHPVQSTIRQEFLKKLTEDGYNVTVIGYYWDKFKEGINARFLGGFTGYPLTQILSQSKIALNFANDLLSNVELGFSDRVMKIMGAGCFCLSHEILGIEEILIPNKHLVTYFDYGDMKERIDYYLEHEDERERIAKTGQNEVLSKYNIDLVTDMYLEEIKKLLKNK